MKKTIATIAFMLLCAGASSALAVDTYHTGDATGAYAIPVTATPAMSMKVSANVGVAYNAASDGTTYSLCTSHLKGSKSYGSSSADTRIYMHDQTNVTSMDAPGAGTTTPPDWAAGGWTVMQ